MKAARTLEHAEFIKDLSDFTTHAQEIGLEHTALAMAFAYKVGIYEIAGDPDPARTAFAELKALGEKAKGL
jgi:hypothetical protein